MVMKWLRDIFLGDSYLLGEYFRDKKLVLKGGFEEEIFELWEF